MKDKLNQFVDNLNGQFVEVSYNKALYQCMDLVYNWVFALDLPKATIQHLYAYEVYTKPRAITHEHFYLIPNTPEAIPQTGDLVVWKYGVAGHIAVAIGEGDLNSFMVFEQNSPLGSNAHIQSRSYVNVLGWLRPKKIPSATQPPSEIGPSTKIPLSEPWGEMEVQAIESTLNDQARDLENCKSSCKESTKLAVDKAIKKNDEIWQSVVESANGTKREMVKSMSIWEFIYNKVWRR